MVADEHRDATPADVEHAALWLRVSKALLVGTAPERRPLPDAAAVDLPAVHEVMLAVRQKLAVAFPDLLGDSSFGGSDATRSEGPAKGPATMPSWTCSEDNECSEDVASEGSADTAPGSEPEALDGDEGDLLNERFRTAHTVATPQVTVGAVAAQHVPADPAFVLRPFISLQEDGGLCIDASTVRRFWGDVSGGQQPPVRGDVLAFVGTGNGGGACGMQLLAAAARSRGLQLDVAAARQQFNNDSATCVMIAWGVGCTGALDVYVWLPRGAIQSRGTVLPQNRPAVEALRESVLLALLSLTADVVVDVRGMGSVRFDQSGGRSPGFRGSMQQRVQLLQRCVSEHLWAVRKEAAVLAEVAQLAEEARAQRGDTDRDPDGSSGSTAGLVEAGGLQGSAADTDETLPSIVIVPGLIETPEQAALRRELEQWRFEDAICDGRSEGDARAELDARSEDLPASSEGAGTLRHASPAPRPADACLRQASFVCVVAGLEGHASECQAAQAEFPDRRDLEARLSEKLRALQERAAGDVSAELTASVRGEAEHVQHALAHPAHHPADARCNFVCDPSAQAHHAYVAPHDSFVQTIEEIRRQQPATATGGPQAWLRDVLQLASHVADARTVEDMLTNTDAVSSSLVRNLLGGSAVLRAQRAAEQQRCRAEGLAGAPDGGALSRVNPMAAALQLASEVTQVVRPLFADLLKRLGGDFDGQLDRFFAKLGVRHAGGIVATWEGLKSAAAEKESTLHHQIFRRGRGKEKMMAQLQSEVVAPLLKAYQSRARAELSVSALRRKLSSLQVGAPGGRRVQQAVRELDAAHFSKLFGLVAKRTSEVDAFFVSQEKLHARACLEKGSAWQRVRRHIETGEYTRRLIQHYADTGGPAATAAAAPANPFDLQKELQCAKAEFFNNTVHFLGQTSGADELKAKYFLEFMNEQSMAALAAVVDTCGQSGGAVCSSNLRAASACATQKLELLHGLSEMYKACSEDHKRVTAALQQAYTLCKRDLEVVAAETQSAHDAWMAAMRKRNEFVEKVTNQLAQGSAAGEGDQALSGVDPALVAALQRSAALVESSEAFYENTAAQCQQLRQVVAEVHRHYDELDRRNKEVEENGFLQGLVGLAVGVVGAMVAVACPVIGVAMVSAGVSGVLNQGQPWDDFLKGMAKSAVVGAVTGGCAGLLAQPLANLGMGTLVTNCLAGSCASGAGAVTSNLLDGRAWNEGLGNAALLGVIGGGVQTLGSAIASTDAMQSFAERAQEALSVELRTVEMVGDAFKGIVTNTVGAAVTAGQVDFGEICRDAVVSTAVAQGFHRMGRPLGERIADKAQARQEQKLIRRLAEDEFGGNTQAAEEMVSQLKRVRQQQVDAASCSLGDAVYDKEVGTFRAGYAERSIEEHCAAAQQAAHAAPASGGAHQPGEESGAATFKQAFRAARQSGKTVFEWHGKPYTTDMLPGPPVLPAPALQPGGRPGGPSSQPASDGPRRPAGPPQAAPMPPLPSDEWLSSVLLPLELCGAAGKLGFSGAAVLSAERPLLAAAEHVTMVKEFIGEAGRRSNLDPAKLKGFFEAQQAGSFNRSAALAGKHAQQTAKGVAVQKHPNATHRSVDLNVVRSDGTIADTVQCKTSVDAKRADKALNASRYKGVGQLVRNDAAGATGQGPRATSTSIRMEVEGGRGVFGARKNVVVKSDPIKTDQLEKLTRDAVREAKAMKKGVGVLQRFENTLRTGSKWADFVGKTILIGGVAYSVTSNVVSVTTGDKTSGQALVAVVKDITPAVTSYIGAAAGAQLGAAAGCAVGGPVGAIVGSVVGGGVGAAAGAVAGSTAVAAGSTSK